MINKEFETKQLHKVLLQALNNNCFRWTKLNTSFQLTKINTRIALTLLLVIWCWIVLRILKLKHLFVSFEYLMKFCLKYSLIIYYVIRAPKIKNLFKFLYFLINFYDLPMQKHPLINKFYEKIKKWNIWLFCPICPL